MKTLLFVMLFGLVSALAFADMTVVQKVQTGAMMGQPAHSDTMTLAMKGSKARMDFGKISQIIDLDTHKLYKIDAAKKNIMVMSTDLSKETADMISRIGEDTKIDVRNTGKTETIDGYKCMEYVMTMSGPMSMVTTFWMTQDIDAKEFERFKTFGMQIPKMKGSESMADMKGIAIKSTSKTTLMGHVIDSSTEIQSVSNDTVSASLFDLPKDYKVIEIPTMPSGKPQR